MPRLRLYYHYFHPDDVVSARHYGDLAREQQRRGWQVSVVTSNRSCRDRAAAYPSYENWDGIEIHRVARPDWDQSQAVPRLASSAALTAGWLLRSLRLGPVDAIVIGSDPAFSASLALGLRRLHPRTPIVHWCFDMYPEAIEAEGTGGAALQWLAPLARKLMGLSYRRYDELVDLGARMRERLAAYGAGVPQDTLVPWALVEADRAAAPDPAVRAELFPRAKLALLYSGTMGRAHEYQPFLDLARACRARSGDAVSVCFASRGNRYEELRRAVTSADTNVSFAPFAEESALQARLEAADLHLLSLRPEWAGVVVPSKFFGSLAVGRPVLYAGPGDSEIARWVQQLDVGMALSDHNLAETVDRLHGLMADPGDIARWQNNALAVYQREFSRRVVNDRWDALLRRLVAQRAATSA